MAWMDSISFNAGFEDASYNSGNDIDTSTQSRTGHRRPLILVCGARPEERACLLRLFPMWEFRFVAYESLGAIYTEMSLRPESSMVLMAKRYLEGPEMISFFCQMGMPYYLFENKTDLARADWTGKVMGAVG